MGEFELPGTIVDLAASRDRSVALALTMNGSLYRIQPGKVEPLQLRVPGPWHAGDFIGRAIVAGEHAGQWLICSAAAVTLVDGDVVNPEMLEGPDVRRCAFQKKSPVWLTARGLMVGGRVQHATDGVYVDGAPFSDGSWLVLEQSKGGALSLAHLRPGGKRRPVESDFLTQYPVLTSGSWVVREPSGSELGVVLPCGTLWFKSPTQATFNPLRALAASRHDDSRLVISVPDIGSKCVPRGVQIGFDTVIPRGVTKAHASRHDALEERELALLPSLESVGGISFVAPTDPCQMTRVRILERFLSEGMPTCSEFADASKRRKNSNEVVLAEKSRTSPLHGLVDPAAPAIAFLDRPEGPVLITISGKLGEAWPFLPE